VRLLHLSLTNFRSFTRLDINVPQGTIVLVGDNAQGKTTLLESVYFLATLTSFHAESDRQLINFLIAPEPLAVARIKADFRRGNRTHHLEVRVIQERNGLAGTPRVRKEILLDDLKIKSSEVIGLFNAVLFLPQMLQVIDGPPRNRRRYLDLAVAQVVPDYTVTLSTYNRIHSQRNALLKQIGEQGGDPNQLDYWDDRLSHLGAWLVHARIQAIQEIEILAALIQRELTQGREVLRLNYRPAFDPLPVPEGQYALDLDDPRDRTGLTVEQIKHRFLDLLHKLRREEIARGVTTIGPHRDEMLFLSNAVDLGTYGSRGQMRTALLTIKLAEVAWMKQKTGHWPVLLLDEVLAELDANRRSDLLARIIESEQTLLTTTDLGLFTPTFIQDAKIWKIKGGRVRLEHEPVSG
jgi:DNA replication and repair protein RecF